MSDNHIISRNIGNLRGLSTDSIFTRPPNVAEKSINMQRAPDGTTQLRRGYQCQSSIIGGLGTGTVDNPTVDEILACTINSDGNLYVRNTKNLYLNYDGSVSGPITGATTSAAQAPSVITSIAHGLVTGEKIIITGVNGMIELNNLSYMINVLTVDTFSIYNLSTTGVITFATNANPCVITSPAHGLITNDQIMIDGVIGMTNLNKVAYTITRIDANNFSLNGVNSTAFPAYVSGGFWAKAMDTSTFPAYTSGGEWTLQFSAGRYLVFTIFTDPRFLIETPQYSVYPWTFPSSPANQSITCQVTVGHSAEVDGNQTAVNVITVFPGHSFQTGQTIIVLTSDGSSVTRTVTATSTTTVTISGAPVNVTDGNYLSQFLDIPFGNGYDVSAPYLLSSFVAQLTDPVLGISGLEVATNGVLSFPAAFLQILEPVIINNETLYTLNFWYWTLVNHSSGTVPFPGSALAQNQNSPDFQNASFAAFDGDLYIANGYDYPQKYDGQTVFRAGMPKGGRPSELDDITNLTPLAMNSVYMYITTYTQVDHIGMGHHAHGAFGLGHAQVFLVHGHVAGQGAKLHVGNGGMQMDGPGEALHVHFAEDVAVDGDFAFHLGEGDVVAAAVGGDVAGDLVGGEIALVGGEVHLHRSGDGVEVDVAVADGEVGAGAQTGRGHVAVARVDRDQGRSGHDDGQVEAAVGLALGLDHDRVSAHGDVRGLGVKDFFDRVIRVRIGDLVRLHLDGLPVGGGNAEVAARVVDVDHPVQGNLRIQDRLVEVVLGPAQRVPETVVVAKAIAHPVPVLVPPGGEDADDGEQDEQAHKAAAAAHRRGPLGVNRPLAQHGHAGQDEEKRPPLSVPVPEAAGVDAAGVNEHGDDADGDEDDGADDGWHPGHVGADHAGLPGMALGAPLIPLRAPRGSLLFAVNPPLGVGIVRGWCARRSIWRYAAHDCPPRLMKSSASAGTMEVPGFAGVTGCCGAPGGGAP